jgi:glycosyltransferase involved in cell wall biosynthesis
MVKRVLMIAFHFPPMHGSSGLQRTLAFSRYLPLHGWEPVVLSAAPRAYPAVSDGQLADIGPGVPVHRSFALDASRHLALRGRYPSVLAVPDRWASWCLSAVPAGLRLIRRHRPDAIWSSYPIASAHLIGLALHRITGIPWIADQRDPMSDDTYPPDPRTWRVHRWIEDQVMRHSASMVCTTPGAIEAYRLRYPTADSARMSLIQNGYDENAFASAGTGQGGAPSPASNQGCFRLVHSGIIYPSERDPSALFAALERLKNEGSLAPANFRLVLRASGHDDYLAALAARHGLEGIVELAPALPYRAALAEMLTADGLLILQASSCNRQIPAKLYEYLRAGRPILALTDAAGDTALTLRTSGIDTIASLDSVQAIHDALPAFLTLARQGRAPVASPASVQSHSRLARTSELAAVLDRIAGKAAA